MPRVFVLRICNFNNNFNVSKKKAQQQQQSNNNNEAQHK